MQCVDVYCNLHRSHVSEDLWRKIRNNRLAHRETVPQYPSTYWLHHAASLIALVEFGLHICSYVVTFSHDFVAFFFKNLFSKIDQ